MRTAEERADQSRTTPPTRDELVANLAHAVKLLGAFPILNATAQVQHLRSVVERATPTPDTTPEVGS